jgi:hypothetical protein
VSEPKKPPSLWGIVGAALVMQAEIARRVRKMFRRPTWPKRSTGNLLILRTKPSARSPDSS